MERDTGLLFKPNFQLFADETEIEIDGKKYTAGSIKELIGSLETANTTLGTVQGDLDAFKGKYTTLEEELNNLKNQGKPEIDILKGQLKDLQGKYDTRGTEIESIQMERRAEWLKTAAKAAGLEESLIQDIQITLEDTPETIAAKVKEKDEAIQRIISDKAKKMGIVLKGGKPTGNEDEDEEYIKKLVGNTEKPKRKKAYDI